MKSCDVCHKKFTVNAICDNCIQARSQEMLSQRKSNLYVETPGAAAYETETDYDLPGQSHYAKHSSFHALNKETDTDYEDIPGQPVYGNLPGQPVYANVVTGHIRSDDVFFDMSDNSAPIALGKRHDGWKIPFVCWGKGWSWNDWKTYGQRRITTISVLLSALGLLGLLALPKSSRNPETCSPEEEQNFINNATDILRNAFNLTNVNVDNLAATLDTVVTELKNGTSHCQNPTELATKISELLPVAVSAVCNLGTLASLLWQNCRQAPSTLPNVGTTGTTVLTPGTTTSTTTSLGTTTTITSSAASTSSGTVTNETSTTGAGTTQVSTQSTPTTSEPTTSTTITTVPSTTTTSTQTTTPSTTITTTTTEPTTTPTTSTTTLTISSSASTASTSNTGTSGTSTSTPSTIITTTTPTTISSSTTSLTLTTTTPTTSSTTTVAPGTSVTLPASSTTTVTTTAAPATTATAATTTVTLSTTTTTTPTTTTINSTTTTPSTTTTTTKTVPITTTATVPVTTTTTTSTIPTTTTTPTTTTQTTTTPTTTSTTTVTVPKTTSTTTPMPTTITTTVPTSTSSTTTTTIASTTLAKTTTSATTTTAVTSTTRSTTTTRTKATIPNISTLPTASTVAGRRRTIDELNHRYTRLSSYGLTQWYGWGAQGAVTQYELDSFKNGLNKWRGTDQEAIKFLRILARYPVSGSVPPKVAQNCPPEWAALRNIELVPYNAGAGARGTKLLKLFADLWETGNFEF